MRAMSSAPEHTFPPSTSSRTAPSGRKGKRLARTDTRPLAPPGRSREEEEAPPPDSPRGAHRAEDKATHLSGRVSCNRPQAARRAWHRRGRRLSSRNSTERGRHLLQRLAVYGQGTRETARSPEAPPSSLLRLSPIIPSLNFTTKHMNIMNGAESKGEKSRLFCQMKWVEKN